MLLQFYFKKSEKEKKKMIYSGKKTEEKQNYHDMISVDGKATVFPVKLKLQGMSFYLKKYINASFPLDDLAERRISKINTVFFSNGNSFY